MFQQIIDQSKKDLQKAVDNFKSDMMKLRASSLSPEILEDIKADCFGQEMPIKQLGSISAISPREIMAQLWDKSYVDGVLKAIEREGLILSSRIDGASIYFTAPALTAESRNDLIKLLNKKKEEAFQELRKLRDKAWKDIQDNFAKGEIREDDKFKGRDKLDEAVRDFREKMDEIAERKEKEILG
ncbi:MAG: ribosome-recycling factor [Candidatus Pacebacteria bacterium]|nr:ribosome-recycling factor [Candidatus Paceibacterota bacterium]